jgi:hypothetical protein
MLAQADEEVAFSWQHLYAMGGHPEDLHVLYSMRSIGEYHLELRMAIEFPEKEFKHGRCAL